MKRWDAILRRIPSGRDIVGVEIGVLRGLTSVHLLEARPRLTLFLVDPWAESLPGDRYHDSGDDNGKKKQNEHNRDMKTALDNVRRYGNRARVIRARSINAVYLANSQELDFVFIDGDHSEEGVAEDIAAWRGMIRKGGWIGGHDYDQPGVPGVKKAVDAAFPSGVQIDSERTWFYMGDL
jgi:hypothetical protein